MENTHKERRFFNFLKYTLLALSPILGFYNGISIISLGTIALLGITVVEMLLNKGAFEMNTPLFVIIMALSVLNLLIGFTFINDVDFTSFLNNSLQMIEMAILCAYFVHSGVAQKDTFYKYIRAVAVVSSLFVFLQAFLYTKGIVLYGFLPTLNLGDLKEYVSISISYGRPNSFFLEPAHYAIYVLPVYTLSLVKKERFISLILLAGLFVSTSSTGIVIGLIITVVFLTYETDMPLLLKWILFLIGVTTLLQFIPAIENSGIFEKINFVNLKDNIRVFGALEYFTHFRIKELLMGVGLNQISNYMALYTGVTIKNYANAFVFSFLSFGVLGGGLWTIYLASLYKLNRNKMLYLVCILICLTDQILFNRNLFFLLLLLYVFSEGDDTEEEETTDETMEVETCGQNTFLE